MNTYCPLHYAVHTHGQTQFYLSLPQRAAQGPRKAAVQGARRVLITLTSGEFLPCLFCYVQMHSLRLSVHTGIGTACDRHTVG